MIKLKIAKDRCPECGKKFFIYNESQHRYGNTIRECKKCKNQYIDPRYHELAITGIRKTDFSVTSFIVLILFGAFILYRGIHFINTRLLGSPDGSNIFFSVIFIFFGSITIIAGIAEIIVIKTGLKAKKFDKLLEESEERLSNYEYAQSLKQAGYDVPEKYL